MKDNEYHLRVYDRALGMRFRPAIYVAVVRDYLGHEGSVEEPDVLLDFRISGRETEPDIDDFLFTSKVLKKEVSGCPEAWSEVGMIGKPGTENSGCTRL